MFRFNYLLDLLCEPDDYNILIDHDKSIKKGFSYLKPYIIDFLIQIYFKKSNFFLEAFHSNSKKMENYIKIEICRISDFNEESFPEIYYIYFIKFINLINVYYNIYMTNVINLFIYIIIFI